MLFDRPVLDFIELIQLSLENVKVTTFLRVEVNIHILIFFECVHDFIELWLTQEQAIVSQDNTFSDLVSWHAQSFLIKVFFEGLLTIRLKSIAMKIANKNMLSIYCSILTQ